MSVTTGLFRKRDSIRVFNSIRASRKNSLHTTIFLIKKMSVVIIAESIRLKVSLAGRLTALPITKKFK